MSNPISICHIISGDLWAGAEVQVYTLCKALKKSTEARPTVVVFNDGILAQRLRDSEIPVDVADETESSPLQMVKTITRHCKIHGTTVLHTHGFKENILGTLAKWLGRIPRSVRTVHGSPEIHHKLTKSPAKWIVNKLDALIGYIAQDSIVAVSDHLREILERQYGRKVRKINNFFDQDQVRIDGDVEGATRPLEFKKDSQSICLGLVGRLVQVKRVDIFIDVVKDLRDRGIDCKGLVFGVGPLEARLKQQASDLGISHHIEFKGFVDPLIKQLTMLDALIMPSDHEGLPMTLLETLALGIPIIAHRKGGIPEVLDEGRCGWLVNEHTPQGYSNVILEAFENDAERLTKQIRGQEFVANEYGLEKNTARYIELYQQTSE